MKNVGWLPLLVLLTLLGETSPALADSRFALDYATNSVCPSKMDLIREIEQRAPSARHLAGNPNEVARAPRDITASIALERVGERVHARVMVSGPDGMMRRDVDGDSCDEVVRAVALIVALALDSDGTSAQGSSAPRLPAARYVRTTRSVVPASTPRRVARTAWWVGAGARFGFSTGIGPHPAPSFGLFVESGARRNALLAANFRLTALHARDAVETAAGTATLALLALRVAACPLGLGANRVVEACATFDVGRLRGRGEHTLNARQRDAAWYGPGISLNAGTTVWQVLRLGANAGVLSPLARDRFYFRPEYTVHRVPTLAIYGALWLGLRT